MKSKALIRKAVDLNRKDGKIIISTYNPDRGGDRVNPQGGHFENYLKNPIVMWLHDYRGQTPAAGIPVARCPGLTISENDIVAEEPKFLENDAFAARVKNAWEQDFIKTASIGFAPLGDPEPNEYGGFDFNEWEMLEWSLVPIPMNADCLRVAKSMGFEDLVAKEIVTKPEETDEATRRKKTLAVMSTIGTALHNNTPSQQTITTGYMQYVETEPPQAQAISQEEIKDELDYMATLVKTGNFNEDNKQAMRALLTEIVRFLGCDNPVKIEQEISLTELDQIISKTKILLE